MNKKLFALGILISMFASVLPAQAFIALPYFDVTINQHAVGGDGTFTFHISKSFVNDHESSPVGDFEIQTVSGSGSNSASSIAGAGDVFAIIQDTPSGWQAPQITCTSPNTLVTSEPTEGGVFVFAAPFSSVVCDFTNTQASVGVSNVLFIPGFQGSRLYTKRGNGSENQLWDPEMNSDVQGLEMNNLGDSKNKNIYTRDVIDRTNFPLESKNIDIYKSFETSLDVLVENGSMSSWQGVAYDWRYDPEYIVSHGVINNAGGLTYINDLTQSQKPFIIGQLESLAQTSKTGKVTIVTHSNGGLIAKALVKKLQAMHDASMSGDINMIDKIVMVAAPQLGTPSSIAKMLHGYDTSIGGGLVLSASTARNFAKNLPGAYPLLPSKKYFDTISSPVVKFDASTDEVNNFRKKYGDSLSTYVSMRNFLLGINDNRKDPDSLNLFDPQVLNATLLNNSSKIHDDLDNYEIPSSIQVYKIAGWGRVTPSGVEYLSQKNCSLIIGCTDILDEKIIPTSDGDKTVVTASAVFGQGISYYVNLKLYNDSHAVNYSHLNILEMIPVQNLIKNLFIGSSELPEYVNTEKPSASDNLVLSIHSPVSIDIYDTEGRHTGITDTRSTSDFQVIDEEIPNSSYIPFGEGIYVSVPNGKDYKISLTGTDFGTFTFEKEHYVNDQFQAQDTNVFSDIPVTPMTVATLTVDQLGLPTQMKIDMDGDGQVDQTLSANSAFDQVQYLEMIKKTVISMQLVQTVENALIKKISKVEKAIQSGKIKNVKLRIRSLLKVVKIHKGHKKHIDKDDKQALVDMFNQLLDNLN